MVHTFEFKKRQMFVDHDLWTSHPSLDEKVIYIWYNGIFHGIEATVFELEGPIL